MATSIEQGGTQQISPTTPRVQTTTGATGGAGAAADAKAKEDLRERQEERNAVEAEEDRRRHELDDELHPKRRGLHRTFLCVKGIAILWALAMAIGQIVGLIYENTTIGPISYVLRVYIVAFCGLVVLNELEVTKMVHDSFVLSNWVTRGVLYSFMGVVGLEENAASGALFDETGNIASNAGALIYIEIVSWGMIATGLLYFCMGLLCCQLVANRLRADYERRRDLAKERRHEINRSILSRGRNHQGTISPVASPAPLV